MTSSHRTQDENGEGPAEPVFRGSDRSLESDAKREQEIEKKRQGSSVAAAAAPIDVRRVQVESGGSIFAFVGSVQGDNGGQSQPGPIGREFDVPTVRIGDVETVHHHFDQGSLGRRSCSET